MRGRGSLPPWAWRQRRGPSPLLAAPLPPWGFSPTWGKGRGWSPSLAYIRRGGGAFFNNTLSFSLSFSDIERTPLVWSLHLVGGFIIIWTPSRCRNLDPDQSSFRCSSGS